MRPPAPDEFYQLWCALGRKIASLLFGRPAFGPRAPLDACYFTDKSSKHSNALRDHCWKEITMRLLTTWLSLISILLTGLVSCRPVRREASGPEVPTQLPRTARPLHYSISVVPDAANLRFTGSEAIDIEVLHPTDSITLNAAALEFQAVTLTDKANKNVEARTSVDADKQTATFKFPSVLSSGNYRLAINYTGEINLNATGLFALHYDSPEGRKGALFTVFEAPDALRFITCWVETYYSASFSVHIMLLSSKE